MANKDTRTFMGTLSFDSGRGNTLRVKITPSEKVALFSIKEVIAIQKLNVV